MTFALSRQSQLFDCTVPTDLEKQYRSQAVMHGCLPAGRENQHIAINDIMGTSTYVNMPARIVSK